MKNYLKISAYALLLFLLASCQDQNTPEQPQLEDVPNEILDKVDALGFNANEVRMYDGTLFIEGDIAIPVSKLDQMKPGQRIPTEEQYSTDNLVAGNPRTINVFVDMPQKYKDATDIANARYNAESLNLTFQRVTSSSGADITIKASPWYYRF